VVLDWDHEAATVTAETFGQHFLHGDTVSLSNSDPSEALHSLADKWRTTDEHQRVIFDIDNLSDSDD
jgi:hypothetical protein